ncbi:MAG: hypothetical protein IJV55_02845 [Paludibacteraceae bacterium]|nr:hypothetical protein [Paludibacteraceae bacterium]
MKPYKILLFILCTGGLFGLAAWFFPREGVTVQGIRFSLPDLRGRWQQLTAAPDTAAAVAPLSPEQLLMQRAEELRRAEEGEYLDYFSRNPARIRWPHRVVERQDTVAVAADSAVVTVRRDTVLRYDYFDPLYAALDDAAATPVRIAHYGDSQIEEDRMTMTLRRTLQQRFGGGGPGLLPYWQAVPTRTMSQHTQPQPVRYTVFGTKNMHRHDAKRYGPMGQVSLLDGTGSVSVRSRDGGRGLPTERFFNRLTLLSRSETPLGIRLRGGEHTVQPDGAAMQLTTLSLPDSTTNLSLTLAGKGEIYAMAVDNNTGVSVDNIPMRGCAGTLFTDMDAAQLGLWFSRSNTRLVILQYSGNAVPYMKNRRSLETYLKRLQPQLAFMQRCAPGAVFLFIGPSDMTMRIDGQMQTYPMLPEIDRRLAETVNAQGMAYWSLFESMGGTGSMQRWVQAGLAAADYIHFMHRGADEAGAMLSRALMLGYDYYDFRRDTERQLKRLREEADSQAAADTLLTGND